MKHIRNLNDLMVEQLRDLYNAERLFDTFLPSIIGATHSPTLQRILAQYLRDNEGQVMRLRQVFEQQLFITDSGEVCEAMEAMVDEAYEIIDHCEHPNVRDAGIITALQHIIHYKIAGYGTICAYANTLGFLDVAGIIHKNLLEEKKTDSALRNLAEAVINDLAAEEETA
jgi:ferritin-like metal-binding protein YciE